MCSLKKGCTVNLSIVAELIALLFTLMWSDEQTEAVFLQKRLSHVWSEVTASATERVWKTAILIFRVTPEDVHNL